MKTNKERAGFIIPQFIEHIKWGAEWADIEAPIVEALDKAEARGAKKAYPCCKPSPQFDAEKVKRLIIQYGKLHTACANTKSFIVDDCGEMQATYYKLLAALGIDY